MTLPHQCRCVTCGEIGVIVPSLPNVFDSMPRAYGGTGGDAKTIMGNTPEVERRKTPIVPEETISPYASSRADELAPRFADIPTCTHGYTRCMPCKFPAP